MGELFKKIKGKKVELSEPSNAMVSDMIGREAEMRKILSAWTTLSDRHPLAPLLVGEPGLGKTRLVYEMAQRCRKGMYTYQGHEDVTNEDLVCAVRFSDDPNRKMDYILRALPTAMICGGIFFLDGIAKMRKKALALLESVLDERQYIESDLLGFRVHASPGFRFIAATNPSDLEANPLPDYIRSRIKPVIHFSYPSREEINQILLTRYRRLQDGSKSLIDLFWRLWRSNNDGTPPSARDAIDIFSYAHGLAEVDFTDMMPHIAYENQGVSYTLEKTHLEEAFDVFFNTNDERCKL